MSEKLLEIKDEKLSFFTPAGEVKALNGVSFSMNEGEVLGIVGESGSGKSVFTKNFVGMLDANGKITGGSIMFEGRDMTKFTEKDWLGVRGKKIAMVMQDPMTSLNPLKKFSCASGNCLPQIAAHHPVREHWILRYLPVTATADCWS